MKQTPSEVMHSAITARDGMALACSVVLVCSAALAACAPPTQLLVEVRSDPSTREFASVTVETLAEGEDAPVGSHDFATPELPFSLAVVPRGGDARRTLHIVARGAPTGGGPPLTGQVRVQPREGRSLLVVIELSEACDAVVCDDGEQCIGGTCMRIAEAPRDDAGTDAGSVDGGGPFDGGEPFDAGPDDDGDGVPNDRDLCPGADDRNDADGDRVPDGCDRCAAGDDALDADFDGVPDGCDACPGIDDRAPPAVMHGSFMSTLPWTLRAGATIDTGAPGAGDLGDAVFPGASLCSAPTITQPVCMPRTEIAPLALRLWSTYGVLGAPGTAELIVGLEGGPEEGLGPIEATAPYDERLVCLGEAWYAAAARLAVGLRSRQTTCSPTGAPDVRVDRVTIGIDTTYCPLIGRVLHGTFDAGLTGWVGSANAMTFMDGTNPAAHLHTNNPCQTSSLRGRLSVPRTARLPRPALRFRWRGTLHDGVPDTTFLAVVVNGGRDASAFRQFSAPAPAAWTTAIVCLPPDLAGHAATVYFELAASALECTPAVSSDVYLDDVELVSEASCP